MDNRCFGDVCKSLETQDPGKAAECVKSRTVTEDIDGCKRRVLESVHCRPRRVSPYFVGSSIIGSSGHRTPYDQMKLTSFSQGLLGSPEWRTEAKPITERDPCGSGALVTGVAACPSESSESRKRGDRTGIASNEAMLRAKAYSVGVRRRTQPAFGPLGAAVAYDVSIALWTTPINTISFLGGVSIETLDMALKYRDHLRDHGGRCVGETGCPMKRGRLQQIGPSTGGMDGCQRRLTAHVRRGPLERTCM